MPNYTRFFLYKFWTQPIFKSCPKFNKIQIIARQKNWIIVSIKKRNAKRSIHSTLYWKYAFLLFIKFRSTDTEILPKVQQNTNHSFDTSKNCVKQTAFKIVARLDITEIVARIWDLQKEDLQKNWWFFFLFLLLIDKADWFSECSNFNGFLSTKS